MLGCLHPFEASKTFETTHINASNTSKALSHQLTKAVRDPDDTHPAWRLKTANAMAITTAMPIPTATAMTIAMTAATATATAIVLLLMWLQRLLPLPPPLLLQLWLPRTTTDTHDCKQKTVPNRF